MAIIVSEIHRYDDYIYNLSAILSSS